MIITTWNVNSISVRLPHLIEWLKQHKPNVVCLQETKTVDEKFPHEELAQLGYSCEFFGEPSYNGVAILSNQPILNVRKGFVGEGPEKAKRLIEAQIGSTYIINVYIPNGSHVGSTKYEYKLNWLQQLHEHIASHHDLSKRVIICGDFNIAPDDKDCYNPEQIKGTIMVSEPERSRLEEVRKLGFTDLFRLHNQDAGQFTWWDYRMGAFRRNMGYRIDHIWSSQSMASACTNVWIDKATRKLERPSDHAPLVAEFN
jgi:exodeoxyribonuclease-3